MKIKSIILPACFTLLFMLLSAIHVVFAMDAPWVMHAITKGLPMVLLLAGVLVSGKGHSLSAWALVFSLFGDVVSEMPLSGSLCTFCLLGFFSVAQVLYSLEFSRYSGKRGKVMPEGTYSVLPFIVAGYAALVVNMVVSAWRQNRPCKWLFRVGSLLFLISDALIGVGWCFGDFPCRDVLVMITYYAAQFLLNATVLFHVARGGTQTE